MSVLPMSDLVRLMVAAGPVRVIPVRASWPLHKALLELSEDDRRLLSLNVGASWSTYLDPSAGVAVHGAEAALIELLESGAFIQEGCGYLARWRLTGPADQTLRRQLMAEAAETSAVVHRAGKRWATLAATVLKNADTAARSWDSTVVVKPNRLAALPGLA